ncbi:MAG: stage II sporulation protein R, partial [Clostridia bacterium]|nr:stage II sporulation protein R [Clostridia bacterium]
EWYDTREYEEFALPCGYYKSLRIIIGKGEGKNWWCVMFPSICLPAATPQNQGFKGVLEDDTAQLVEQPKRYKARFKVVEIFEKARKSIANIFE